MMAPRSVVHTCEVQGEENVVAMERGFGMLCRLSLRMRGLLYFSVDAAKPEVVARPAGRLGKHS
jgi:hypothetical protein